jgi:hypothetical protein
VVARNPLTSPQISTATPAERYLEVGLGALPDGTPASLLYIDLMKRAVSNILYEDKPVWRIDDARMQFGGDFNLNDRLIGRDMPTEAHTMVGLKRLDHLQMCVETVLSDAVPGDFVEAGVLRGGASIFMRAVLKAHGVTDRKIIACDTFVAPTPLPTGFLFRLGLRVVSWMSRVPSRRWQRQLFLALQKIRGDQRRFPMVTDPSDQLIDGAMAVIRNPRLLRVSVDRTSLNAVRSHFARYGLLDSQVVFLQGFFSDTLPAVPIERVALLRLDGDTYESTRDVLVAMYPKLQPHGYCVIDDYALTDCRRAVDEYRAEHGIRDEILPIDRDAAYWRKSTLVG